MIALTTALLDSPLQLIKPKTAPLLRGSAFNVEEPGELVGKVLVEQDAPARPKKVLLDDLWEWVVTMMQEQVDEALADMIIFDGTLSAGQ